MGDNSEVMISKADVLRIIDEHNDKVFTYVRRADKGVWMPHISAYNYETVIKEIESLG